MKLSILCMSLFLFCGGLVTSMEQPSGFQGDYFTAIPIPQNIKYILSDIQKELHQCLGNDFSPSALDNLHITIQVIEGSNVDRMKQGLKNVKKSFRQFAKSRKWDKPWHFEAKIQDSDIKIGDKGHVKLHVGESALLKQLGQIIEQELNRVGVKTKRNDVAGAKYSAHITLGMIPTSLVSKANSKHCKVDAQKKFAHTQFIIDRFVLLQSNRPAKIRKYALRGEYKLKLGEK